MHRTGKHGIRYCVSVPALCAVKGHAAEYEIGEIKAAGSRAFGTGEGYPAKVYMLIIGDQSVDQHVCYLLTPTSGTGEFYYISGHNGLSFTIIYC